MRILLLFVALFSSFSLVAEENKYAIKDIPVDLVKDANSVIRVNSTTYTVLSNSKTVENVKFAISILNKKANKLGVFNERYSSLNSLYVLYIKVYDKDGKLVRKIKRNKIIDSVSKPGFVFFSDSRRKYYIYRTSNYPFTIEYEYEKRYKSIISYAHWFPISSYDSSLENASFEFRIPSSMDFKYRNNNFETKPSVVNANNILMYTWSLTSFKAINNEYSSPSFIRKFPNVLITPTKFVYDGFAGDMSSWSSYGKWTYSLLKGRDVLPESTKAKIISLVSGINSKREIVKKIYEYVQNTTRYVCVSLGIGGFQPFSARDVVENGYGDCKALSNYTKALLKLVGIEAIYAEIGAGCSQKILYDDFSSSDQTNHIILCVPMQRDSIWLECTSQISPFNYLGSCSSDRYALLIKKDGGELVKTHQYNKKDNLKESVSKIELLENGSLECSVCSKYHSLMFEYIDDYFSKSYAARLESLSLSNYDIQDCSFKMLNDGKYTCGQRDISFTLNNYLSLNKKRVFLPVNLINKNYYSFRKKKNRKSRIVEDECYTIMDTISIKIPDYYVVENLPKERDIKSVYGSYKSSFSIGESLITFTRTMTINKGEYPVEKFNECYSFHKKIRKAEKAKIVLLKSDV